jgi:spore germination protein KA
MVDTKHIDLNIMKPFLTEPYILGLNTGPEIVKELSLGNIVTRAQIKKSRNMKGVMDGLLVGEAVLLIEGIDEGYNISSQGYDYRAVTESDNESVARGPRDAFIEVLSINLGLIRRRIHSPNLVFESMKVGRVTQTMVCIGYIKGICPSKLVEEVRLRISRIDIDGILESNYIEELISDGPLSVFPKIRNTERPDSASSALLEGRVVIIVDNTPIALIIPGELFSLLQSAEDHYNGYFFSSLIRILRYISYAIGLTLPSFYIAITNFHQELVPTKLLESIISARTGVPLPNFVEAVLMEGTFELLREAGLRLPKRLGQAVSIVGALVIGQSAVQASLVSPLMVIVVSLTGIAIFTIPQYSISHPVRILRFPLMIVSSILGLYGLLLGLLFILLHLCSIRSFGTPYLTPIAPFKARDLKDTVIRAPFWSFKGRPRSAIQNNRPMSSGKMPKPPEDGRNNS